MAHDGQRITTPFGGGKFSVAMLERQIWLDEQRGNLGDNEKPAVNKWHLLRAITQARAIYGLSDRSLVVLEALLSFYPETELDGMEDMIVFPSNNELSLRSRGMAPATLRRHLASLVGAGMILRKDSANGKRFCRRNHKGGQGEAFGFNLAPFALMASEIFDAAEKCCAYEKARQTARTEITLHLRNCRQLINLALEEARGDKECWQAFEERLDALSGRVSRIAPLDALEERQSTLRRLMAEIENYWLAMLDEEDVQDQDNDLDNNKDNKMSGTDIHFERHIHNSKIDNQFENSIKNKKSDDEPNKTSQSVINESETISLNRLSYCCPHFMSFTAGNTLNWNNIKQAAHLVQPMLGISSHAWQKALNVMGEGKAIALLAYLTERHDEIKSPGGYLRKLTERAENGKLSLKAMFDSLETRRKEMR